MDDDRVDDDRVDDENRADASDDLRRLPTAHAVALRLWRRGADTSVIADALGIDAGAVPGLIDVAERKLARLRNPNVDHSPTD